MISNLDILSANMGNINELVSKTKANNSKNKSNIGRKGFKINNCTLPKTIDERKKVMMKGNLFDERIVSEIQIYSLNKYSQANS